MKLLEEAVKGGAEFYFSTDGALYSMNPPETMWGFTYHAHMIPPYKPEHALILGYGAGTVASLIRKVWGSVKITGVDCQKYDLKYVEYKMKVMDAYDFVKDCTSGILKTRFDYICVDLWDGKTCVDYVADIEFVVRLAEMSKKMICLNIPADKFRQYGVPYFDYGFKFERFVEVDAQNVCWWSVIEKK